MSLNSPNPLYTQEEVDWIYGRIEHLQQEIGVNAWQAVALARDRFWYARVQSAAAVLFLNDSADRCCIDLWQTLFPEHHQVPVAHRPYWNLPLRPQVGTAPPARPTAAATSQVTASLLGLYQQQAERCLAQLQADEAARAAPKPLRHVTPELLETVCQLLAERFVEAIGKSLCAQGRSELTRPQGAELLAGLALGLQDLVRPKRSPATPIGSPGDMR